MKKKIADNGPIDVTRDEEPPEEAKVETGAAHSAAAKAVVGRLTDARIERLESIGFVWSLRDDWTKHYEELKEYKKEFGNCLVSS